jgi:hypothetical protein
LGVGEGEVFVIYEMLGFVGGGGVILGKGYWEKRTIVSVRILISADSLALGCEREGLGAGGVDGGFGVGGFVIAVTA